MAKPPAFNITALTKADGALTKRISLNSTGKIVADGSACIMPRGYARRATFDHIQHFADFIGNLDSNGAIALGALRPDLPDQVEIVTKSALETLNGTPRLDIIARTGEHIRYRAGQPALMLLDYDTKGMPRQVAAYLEAFGGVWPALCSVVPELANTARVLRRSTSSGLIRSDTGEKLPGLDGAHVFVLAEDGTDLERFLKALHERCWLAGLGWLMVGAGGQLLERSIVDRMVGAPERLVFEGRPVLEPPLVQDQERRQPIVREGNALDTLTACPPLSIIEQAHLRELRAKAAQQLAPESAKARDAFVRVRAERLAERTGQPLAAAAKIIARQCRGVLLPDVVLPFDDSELAGATVGDVLADPARFEGCTLADPLEGIEYGACKAKVMRQATGAPWIHSFAHGRTTYKLRYDANSVRSAIDTAPADQAADVFVARTLMAELDHDEVEELRNAAAKKAGLGKRTIASKLKAAQNRQKEEQHAEEQARRTAERKDPRPELRVPENNAPWIPVMATLCEAHGQSSALEPPTRDGEHSCIAPQTCRVPGLHQIVSQTANDESEEP